MLDRGKDGLTRRQILWIVPLALGGTAALSLRRYLSPHDSLPGSETGAEVTIVEFDDSGLRIGSMRVGKTVRSDEDWWSRLTPQQFYVTRKQATDPPFTGTYFRLHQKSLYRCIGCETALFSSAAKYDSGTGWPSFWEPIAKENLRTTAEPQASLISGIEVLCKRCDAHLGHIFGDGPRPTGLRYCINESALRMLPIA